MINTKNKKGNYDRENDGSTDYYNDQVFYTNCMFFFIGILALFVGRPTNRQITLSSAKAHIRQDLSPVSRVCLKYMQSNQ